MVSYGYVSGRRRANPPQMKLLQGRGLPSLSRNDSAASQS